MIVSYCLETISDAPVAEIRALQFISRLLLLSVLPGLCHVSDI